MFERTRNQLTRLFSLTIGIILALSAIFSLWMVQSILTSRENNQLSTLSRQYAQDMQGFINSPKGAILLDPAQDLMKKSAAFVSNGMQPSQAAWVLSPQGQIVVQSTSEYEKVQFPDPSLLPELFKRADGEYRNVSFEGRTFRIGGTKIPWKAGDSYFLIVGQDVTNDVALLVKLRWAFAGFAVVLLLAGATAGYVLAGRAMVPISDAFRRQEQFTSDASHELRTPLSILRSSVEVLNEQREQLPEFHRSVLVKTGSEIHHMSRLVDNLLLLARSDNGRIELAKSTFSLRATVRQVIEQLEPIAVSKRVLLRWSDGPGCADTDDAPVHGDEVRIRQLAIILAENAIQYNRDGGSVMFSVEAGPDETSLAVTDTGIGIPSEHLPHIFERFYRIDQARTRRAEGTGLGLAIAKQIANSHRGKLQVWSEPQVGTTFRVTFPNVAD
ncbi:sensor histidine kinase [Paenibacillus sp. HJGM_3]|uniref:sensor histidine kinase n=1 Tax=Paenibacillus sp. HJGM_3 TaxID=3379816 RepID=UPI00386C9B2E